MSAAEHLFYPCDEWFAEYMELMDFAGAAAASQMTMKKTHSIVPKWPHRLTKRFGQSGAQKEFDELYESGFIGERYVEWQLAK